MVVFNGYMSLVQFQEVSLINAVILTLGCCINDPSKFVRALCCELLGKISISDETMAKALLSKEPKSDLPWSFCGSFIIALEDEFEMVRFSVVQAINQIASRSQAFAEISTDFLVDSIQDESLKVKNRAFNVLVRIYENHSIFAKLPHLEGILAHLDDTAQGSRIEARKLLSSINLSGEDLLIKITKCLPIAIGRYHEEVEQYMNCLANLGKRNAKLVGLSMGRLLKVEKFFLLPEPKIEDITYQVRLMIIFSALLALPNIVTQVPASFVFKHYRYMKARYQCTPDFRGHQLHEFFFYCKPPRSIIISKIEKERLLGKIGDVIHKTDLTETELLALRLRVKYNVAQLSSSFVSFLLRLIEQLKRREKLDNVFLEFENIDPILADYLSRKDFRPIPYCPNILRVTGTINLLNTAPLRTLGRLPLILKISGHLNLKPRNAVFLLVTCPEFAPFTTKITITCSYLFEKLVYIPMNCLSSLTLGSHKVTACLCVGNANAYSQLDEFAVYIEKITTFP